MAEAIDTTVPCSKLTKERLRDMGKKGETYDKILNRIMDVYMTQMKQTTPGGVPTR